MRTPPRAALSLSFALLVGSTACGGCEGERPMAKEGRRLWGKERLDSEIETKAKESLDAYLLAERPDLKNRVLAMSWPEAVARLGHIEYTGVARFHLSRNGNELKVVEDSLVEHGLHGSFRVLQKDEDGVLSREVVYNNGVVYVRNGPGKMHVQGMSDGRHYDHPEEAWQPLRVFTSYYGPRAGLRKTGAGQVAGRGAAKYDLVLLDGSPLISVPGMKGSKKPVSLEGQLFVDEATGVPLKGSMKGLLEIPGEGEPGKLRLELSFQVKTIPAEEKKPVDFVPTIERRPVDLDPLSFLEGGARTSTVIGGKRPPRAAPVLEDAEGDEGGE